MADTSGCVSFPNGPATITSPSSLSRTAPTSFVTRQGRKLMLDGAEFKAVGPNVYWLGLDENINNAISYPTQGRVLEIMATAAAMGATTIRSTTLGVSVGHPLTINPSLGVFNEEARQRVDYAVYAASTYGLRLIIPLTDEWQYYHGGKSTFLGFRNISDTDVNAFYTNTDVISDFKQYIGTLINRTNTYTNLTYANDPTVLCWETGNELKNAPAAWTSDITSYIKTLAPNQLTMDGSYGPQKDALDLPTVDMYSNHYYPLERQKLKADSKAVAAANKAYYIGEYDWTDKYSRYGLLACLIPLIFVIIAFCLPGRWFPWTFYLPRWLSFKKSRSRSPVSGHAPVSAYSPIYETPPGAQGDSTSKLESEYPPPLVNTENVAYTDRRKIVIRKWMFALSFLLLIPFAAWIALEVGPIGLTKFLKMAEDRDVAGTAYWSLFGRDDSCCRWVEHNDGFTLHYRRDSNLKRSLELTQHAYRMTGAKALFNLGKESDLPVVGCFQ